MHRLIEFTLMDVHGLSRTEMDAIDFQKNNFAALSVGDIRQYYLLPAALRNEFSENLYGVSYCP